VFLLVDPSQKDFFENLEKNLKDMGFTTDNTYKSLVAFFKLEPCVSITLKSDEKEAEKNVQKSEKAYLKGQSNIALRICLKRNIHKLFLRKRKELKLYERLILNPFKTNYPLELIEIGSTKKNTFEVQSFLASLNAKTDIFETLDKHIRWVVHYYATHIIENPTDFHYISNIITKMVGLGQEYISFIKESYTNREILKKTDFKEVVKEKLKDLEELTEEYVAWSQKKQVRAAEEKLSTKKQKQPRVKWEEEALMLKMQEIAKKRKGQKKQDLQQIQAMRLKIFGKR